MSLVTCTPMALRIDCRDLPNRVRALFTSVWGIKTGVLDQCNLLDLHTLTLTH